MSNIQNAIFTTLVVAIIFTFSSCNTTPDGPRIALISTSLGDVKIELSDETPIHRDNFIKLVNEGFYNNQLFHRVVDSFMIQGGDPGSVEASRVSKLGTGGPGYTLQAEIVYPSLFHKRGALAAARMPDSSNPSKKSSGSQFYIVQGITWSKDQLRELAVRRNDDVRSVIFNRCVRKFNDSIQIYQTEPTKLMALQEKIMFEVDSTMRAQGIFTFTPDMVDIYDSIGGTPQLDKDYTVFGQVIEGMDVVEKISAQPTDRRSRPKTDVTMSIKMLN